MICTLCKQDVVKLFCRFCDESYYVCGCRNGQDAYNRHKHLAEFASRSLDIERHFRGNHDPVSESQE